MSKREKAINGKYIGNAIGYCKLHEGALNNEIAIRHKCLGKKCKHLVKYNEESWKLKDKFFKTKKKERSFNNAYLYN